MFLVCPKYAVKRSVLLRSLHSLDVPCTLVNLLGGGPYNLSVQSDIITVVVAYLVDRDRLSGL